MNRPLTFHGRLPGVVCEAALPPRDENPLRLDVTGFVGLAERGPLNIPVALHDIEQYRAVFGGDLRLARMSQGNQIVYANLQRAVQAFFYNGGQLCYVVRVAGAHAQANLFRIPGLLAWDSNAKMLQSVVIPAAWPGRWSETLGVGTQLLSQPLSVPLARPAIEWQQDGNFALHLLLPTTMNVQQNDVLRLHFDGPGNPLIYCYAETPQREVDSEATVWEFPVRIEPVANSTQAFTTNIHPLPLPISVGKQQGNDCTSLDVHAPSLEELKDLEDGYILRMPSTIQVKKADVLCIECVGGEELLFPVESISQQPGNNGAMPGQGEHVLTSRLPTWKLTPTLAQHLTPDGWVSLHVLLSARQLEVRMARNNREYRLYLEAEDASKIQIGDVLLVTVTHGGQLLFPVSDVQIPLQHSGASSASSQSLSQVSSPSDVLDAQVISKHALWLFSLPSSSAASYSGSLDPLLVAASLPPSSASSPPLHGSFGALLKVERLTFNVYVREGEKVVETWSDLRFGILPANPAAMQNSMQSQASPLGARSWLDVMVPSTDELRKEIAHPGVVQRDIPGLDPVRSALLGMPISLSKAENGTTVAPLYFPLCMDDLPLPDEFAGPLDPTSAIVLSSGGTDTFSGGTDDLETFEPERLFLDERLAGVGYRDLINEANAILFASPDVEANPFKGLHSLLFIDEIGIVALPDLPQRGWKRGKLQAQGDQHIMESDMHVKRDWSQFNACHQQRQPPPRPEVQPSVELVSGSSDY